MAPEQARDNGGMTDSSTLTPAHPAGTTQQAILAGGCFWCTEAVMQQVRGVLKIESGYIGGMTPNPDYRSVCGGETGHAEAVRVTFDPAQVSYNDLLGLFFATHDPTSLNRQGADAGTQYRSAVFPLNAEQEREVRAVMADLEAQGTFDKPIVTTVEPATEFYVAEDYHQNYYNDNARQPYCAAVIAPKVAKLRRDYAEKLNA